MPCTFETSLLPQAMDICSRDLAPVIIRRRGAEILGGIDGVFVTRLFTAHVIVHDTQQSWIDHHQTCWCADRRLKAKQESDCATSLGALRVCVNQSRLQLAFVSLDRPAVIGARDNKRDKAHLPHSRVSFIVATNCTCTYGTC